MIREFLLGFEHRIAGLSPILLLALAVITLLAGIFVWLGGLGYKKTLFVIMGAFCGAAVTASLSTANPLLAVALIVGGALLALKLQDMFLILLVSVLAAIIGFSALIRPYYDTSGELFDIVRQFAIGVPYYNWPILLGLILAPIAFGAAWVQGTPSVLCSAMGTSTLFAGVIMILNRFGIGTVAHVSGRHKLYIGLFVAVTAVGAVVQLLLLPRINSRVAAAKEAAKLKAKKAGKKSKRGDSEPERMSMTSWRTS